MFLRPRMPLLCRTTIPQDSFHAILSHAAAVFVHEAEVRLPEGFALFGGTTNPAECFRVVLRHGRAHGGT